MGQNSAAVMWVNHVFRTERAIRPGQEGIQHHAQETVVPRAQRLLQGLFQDTLQLPIPIELVRRHPDPIEMFLVGRQDVAADLLELQEC